MGCPYLYRLSARTNGPYHTSECNPNIVALFIAEIRMFEKKWHLSTRHKCKEVSFRSKKEFFIVIVIITIHSIFLKVTTVIRQLMAAFSSSILQSRFVEFFWRKILKEVVYSNHQFNIQLKVPTEQFPSLGNPKIAWCKVGNTQFILKNFQTMEVVHGLALS